ncbi:unnamed protein product [Rhizopus stolonifer]
MSSEKQDTEIIDKQWASDNAMAESVDDYEVPTEDTVLENAPWKYKLIAFITVTLLPAGRHFSNNALTAMKSEIKSNLHIDNTKYGVISSSVSIINTISPIFGGIFIDMFGSIWGTLVVNIVVIVGSLLTAIAAKYDSFGLMVAARVIFGIGSSLIIAIQQSLITKWFRSKNLAVAVGVQLSISRLCMFLGTLVANPIAARTGDWVWSFWLSLIICGFSLIMNMIYILVVHHLLKGAQNGILSKDDLKKLKQKKKFDWRTVIKFPLIVWQVLLIEFLFASSWASFQTISTNLVQVRFGSSAVLAGYKASAAQVVPIVASPILGILIEMYGCRVDILLFSAIFFILSMVLLGWTFVNAVVGMVFYSICLALGLISMVTSLGMVLPSEYIGTGFGMYKSANNLGASIFDIVIGIIQDNTANQSYSNVMILFLTIGCVSFFLIAGLWVMQYVAYDNLLETGRKKRMILMKERTEAEMALKKKGADAPENTKIKLFNWISFVIFICIMIVAWVLFFVYSATGSS